MVNQTNTVVLKTCGNEGNIRIGFKPYDNKFKSISIIIPGRKVINASRVTDKLGDATNLSEMKDKLYDQNQNEKIATSNGRVQFSFSLCEDQFILDCMRNRFIKD